jgi:hypothetical protein
MWRLDYMTDFVRRLKRWGFNAVVVEMEDKFRFSNQPALIHPDAPSHAEWREWARGCRDMGVDVIPLVQTLGHLEFALNRPEYATLREAPRLTHHVDVTNPASKAFVLDLVSEVIDVFEPATYVHVGGDETWELARSPRVASLAKQEGRGALYLRHLLPVFSSVSRQGLRPMLWHDMCLSHPEIIDRIPKDVVMVHWDYSIGAAREKEIRIWGGRRPGTRQRGNVVVHWGEEYRRGATPEFRRLLEPFAVDAQTRRDGTFNALYCTDALRAHGLAVLTASANRCAGDQIGTPVVSRHVPNCYCLARKGLEDAEGTLVTSWAIRHNHPETNLSATFAAVLAARGKPGATLALAHEAWTAAVFGLPLPEFATAATQVEVGLPTLGRAGQWRWRLELLLRDDDRLPQDLKDLCKAQGGRAKTAAYLARLRHGYRTALATFRRCKARARRNAALLDYWIEGAELNDFYAAFVQAALAHDLPRRAAALHDTLLRQVAETRRCFTLTYAPRSVEEEILWRYGYHLEVLGRLLAERGPEGHGRKH